LFLNIIFIIYSTNYLLLFFVKHLSAKKNYQKKCRGKRNKASKPQQTKQLGKQVADFFLHFHPLGLTNF